MPWCGGTATGWVAVAVRRTHLHPECFTWLNRQRPVAFVGKTMTVYYIQP
jgi:hypothetical protein